MEYLYHIILPSNHKHHTPIDRILNEGINCSTESNKWYGKGGKLKPALTEKLKPIRTPAWADFTKAIGIELEPKHSDYLIFPVFTDKILVLIKSILIKYLIKPCMKIISTHLKKL